MMDATKRTASEAETLFGGMLSYQQFRKFYPALRNFQCYDHNQRAQHRSSHRLGHQQRDRTGEHFYTHPLLPNVCFPVAKQATTQAYQIYAKQFGGAK